MISKISSRQKMLLLWGICALVLIGLLVIALLPRSAYAVLGGAPEYVTEGFVSCADYAPAEQVLGPEDLSMLDALLSDSTVQITGFYGDSLSLDADEQRYSLSLVGYDSYGNHRTVLAEYHAGDGAFWVPPFRYQLPSRQALAMTEFLRALYGEDPATSP